MTISSTTAKIIYTGDGTDDTFPIPFDFKSTASYVEVWLRDETDPEAITETLQVNPTDYTIVGTDVVMDDAPSASQKLAVRRASPYTQLYDYIAGGVFPQEDHETNLDKIIMALQRVAEKADRSVKLLNTSSISEDDILLDDPVEESVLIYKTGGGIGPGPTTETIQDAIDAGTDAAASAAAATASAAAASASAASAASDAADAAASAAAAAAAAGDIQEVPSGTVDGVNTDFVLASVPLADSGVKVYVDGLFNRQGSDYTIAGDTITFIVAPATGQLIDVVYR